LKARPEGELAILWSLLRFRVLCAHREGLWGELNIDRAIAEHLVTRNDYRRELFIGDVGVVVREPAGNELAVLFESATGESGCRRVPAALVPESRSCYALTIHKSRGSEFHMLHYYRSAKSFAPPSKAWRGRAVLIVLGFVHNHGSTEQSVGGGQPD
jgi:hypothetical protein